MDQWDENMEYLEAYDDACLDEIEDEAEEINRQLDIISLDRMARENGEKPANEWLRTDFKDLLHSYPKLRHWHTRELRALFLDCMEYIDGVAYYKRLSMEDSLRRRDNGDPFWQDLAYPAVIDEDSDFAFYRRAGETAKLWKMWRHL